MENRSLVIMLIGGPENVRTAECTRRFNAKIGPSLFHSLFQRDDLCHNNNAIVLTAYGRIPMDKRIRHYHQINDLIQAQSWYKNLVQRQKISKTLSKQLFDKWTETYAWLLIQKSTNSLLNNDISPSHSTVCSREGSNHMANRSLVSRLIGGPENVRAAECTRRFNAKIGHSLFHSLFQRDDIVGKSLYEKIQLTQDICGGGIGRVVSWQALRDFPRFLGILLSMFSKPKAQYFAHSSFCLHFTCCGCMML